MSRLMNTDYRINYSNSITLTPRYESGLSGLYFPIYVNFEGDLELEQPLDMDLFLLVRTVLGHSCFQRKNPWGIFSINLRQLKATHKSLIALVNRNAQVAQTSATNVSHSTNGRVCFDLF